MFNTLYDYYVVFYIADIWKIRRQIMFDCPKIFENTAISIS